MSSLLVAWGWVKKHITLVGGAILAILGFLFGVTLRKAPVVLTGVDPVKTKAEQDLQNAETKIDAQAVQEKQVDTQQHDAGIAAVVASEQKQEPALQSNDDSTNNYLKNIGSQVRGGSDGGQPK